MKSSDIAIIIYIYIYKQICNIYYEYSKNIARYIMLSRFITVRIPSVDFF